MIYLNRNSLENETADFFTVCLIYIAARKLSATKTLGIYGIKHSVLAKTFLDRESRIFLMLIQERQRISIDYENHSLNGVLLYALTG